MPTENLANISQEVQPKTYGKDGVQFFGTPTKLENVKPIPVDKQKKRNWEVFINGEEIEDVSCLQINHKKMKFTVEYGETLSGWDGPALIEPGGGGSVVIPYYQRAKDDKRFIGVVREMRPNATDKGDSYVYNLPRGAMDPGNTHLETAINELSEETLFNPHGEKLETRINKLPGDAMNPNSSFFDTRGENTDGSDKGVVVYSIKIEEDELRKVDDADQYEFKPETLIQTEDAKNRRMAEKITDTIFIPEEEAVLLRDMFTVAAIARLRYLLEKPQRTGKA